MKVQVRSHMIFNINEYLILTDLTTLYVAEKETYQIIASYQTRGECTAICQKGNEPHLFGITTSGVVFEISLNLEEDNVREFCEEKRILCMSSSHRFSMD